MTTDAMLMLARSRELISDPGFRWMPGMAWFDPRNPEGWHGRWGERRGFIDSDEYSSDCVDPDDPLPDLYDPATEGCLVTLAREAWGEHMILEICYRSHGLVVVNVYHPGMHLARTFSADSAGEALAATIIATPKR